MTLQGLDLLVGRFAGFCRETSESLYCAAGPRQTFVTAHPADTTITTGLGTSRGGGGSVSRSWARSAALGELFERYSLMEVEPERLHWAAETELDHAVSRNSLCHYADWQYQESGFGLARPPGPDQLTPWLEGIDLVTAQQVWIPAETCVFHLPGEAPEHWYTPSSNGAATATDPFNACLSGLFELLERDAFMLMWSHRHSMPHLAFEPVDPVARTIERVLGPARLDHCLVDLSEIHDVPTILALTWGDFAGKTIYGIGASAGSDVGRAALKAISEAAATSETLRHLVASERLKDLSPNEVQTFEEHSIFYINPAYQEQLRFIREAATTRVVRSATPTLRQAKARLHDLAVALGTQGIGVYAVDITPAEGLQVGLYTYKVVSPQLLALDIAHTQRSLGAPRLLTVPVSLGWRQTEAGQAELNPFPHPFP